MSHRHQSSRRRSYGRRQHELGERRGRRGESHLREWLVEDQDVQAGGFRSTGDDGARDTGPRFFDQ